MLRDLYLQFNQAQQDYERELKQLSFLGRLRRERREAREAARQATRLPSAQPKGITA